MPRGGIETANGHWAQLMEDMQASPKAFYDAIYDAIKRRDIPDCRLGRIDWPEGGVFSARRLYLRAERGRDLVDICGAPFGNAFFASTWLCTPRPRIWLAVVIVFAGVFYGFSSAIDLISLIQRNAPQSVWAKSMLQQIAATIVLKIVLACLVTVIALAFGIIRPLFFPPRMTFYRHDTAEMFYRAVHNAVTEVIQGLRSEQGLRLLSDDELKPIMRGFDRRR